MATWRRRLARVFIHLILHTNGTGKVVQLAYDFITFHRFSLVFVFLFFLYGSLVCVGGVDTVERHWRLRYLKQLRGDGQLTNRRLKSASNTGDRVGGVSAGAIVLV